MKKLAVFTEGQTEQLFVQSLLRSVSNTSNIALRLSRMSGGRRYTRIEMQLSSDPTNDETTHYIQVVDCGTDGRVISDVNERYEGLHSAGFDTIIAVRDVRPDFSYADIRKLRETMESALRHDQIVPVLVLATMEVEAWFLAELSHFAKVDTNITPARVLIDLGIDLANAPIEQFPKPADNLIAIYNLEGQSYDKSKEAVERTLRCLDYNELNNGWLARTPSLAPLVKECRRFLT